VKPGAINADALAAASIVLRVRREVVMGLKMCPARSGFQRFFIAAYCEKI
jgi:hypothetical protein